MRETVTNVKFDDLSHTAGCQNYIGVFEILCLFYDKINIFGVITLLLSIEITKFKNWSVDNLLNFFLDSELVIIVKIYLLLDFVFRLNCKGLPLE